MKIIDNKKIIAVALTAVLIMITGSSVHANLQSKSGSRKSNATASDFFQLVRKMETENGPMGLSATVTDAGVETSESNNIDVHMIKNTEYGVVAMLQDSIYGARRSTYSTTNTITTTTGTYAKSGVYGFSVRNTPEFVAGIWSVKYNNAYQYYKNIFDAAPKYKDVYSTANGFIPGDATIETKKWKNWSATNFVSATGPVFIRDSLYIFDYSCVYGNIGSGYYYGTRAVVVCGNGF